MVYLIGTRALLFSGLLLFTFSIETREQTGINRGTFLTLGTNFNRSVDVNGKILYNVGTIDLRSDNNLNGRNEKAWKNCKVEIRKELFLVDDCEETTGWSECVNYTRYDTVVQCKSVDIYDIWGFIPNDTMSIQIENLTTKTLSKSVLKHLEKLEEIKLIKGNVTLISSNFLQGLEHLKRIDLRNNRFFRIHQNIFQYTPNIEEINLSYNYFRNVTALAIALANLKNLRILDLSKNVMIEHLIDATFRTMVNSSLEYLSFAYCQLRVIEPLVFKPFTKLKHLDMSFNPFSQSGVYNITNGLRGSELKILDLRNLPGLSEVPTNELVPLTETPIEELDLSYNYLKSLNEFAFPSMKTLKKLVLSSCGIVVITPGALVKLTGLEELNLSLNRLRALGVLPDDLPNLIYLDISNSNDYSYNPNAFSIEGLSKFTKLKTFKMRGMRSLTEDYLSYKHFANLTSLEYLDMYSTGVKGIEDMAFRDLRNLKSLHLTSNMITKLSNSSFYGLKKLQKLYMGGNEITFDDNCFPFEHLESVEFMYLGKCRILNLPRNIFASLPKLEILNLGYNYITPWNYSVFPVNASLRVVLLSSNQINYVTSPMLEEFKNLEHIDLSKNPFDCTVR